MLKVSPWKWVVRFGKQGKFFPRYVGPFKVLEVIGKVAYKLELPEELSRVHNTFHVSNLKKCHADEPLAIPLDGLHFDDKLHFVEEPVKIVDREVKRLKRSQIPLVKVRWNSKRGLEFMWEREDQFRNTYPHLFAKTASSSSLGDGTLGARRYFIYPRNIDRPTKYGISEALLPELPGLGDRIVDFPEGNVGAYTRRAYIPNCCRLVNKCFQGWDAGEWYLLHRRCEGAGHASYPYPKTTRDVTVHGQNNSQILSGGREIDLFSLIRASNPTKPAVATDSSGVLSTIERSPLDFAHEAEASGRETAAPEMPPPEDVPITTAPRTDQAVETVAVEPPVVQESRKRGHEGIDANAPPKSLQRDHADLRPSGSSRGGKSLAAMQLCLASN
nr:putative reverse transcriptase domain-containing protein [Tanacetum cinerariifolium]